VGVPTAASDGSTRAGVAQISGACSLPGEGGGLLPFGEAGYSQPPRTPTPVLPLNSLVLDERFRVLGHLGGGGMGEVYLAEQVSLGRKVALKVLKREVGQQPGMSERFRREARLLSSVEHPAVVRVIDFGQSEEGTCLVMELAEGETLLQALEAGPLDPERGRRVLVQLAEGLAAIHEKGIIHRDLKPENVVLTSGPRGEQARLLDFGIARLVEPDPDSRGLSQVGVVLGTPEYLSPEQAMGAPLDARSDIYSLGVLAYRMLSGQLPFQGPNARDYLVQHVSAAPRPLLHLVPNVASQPGLAAMVMRSLAKDPKARPQSAQDLVHALELPPAARLPTPFALAAPGPSISQQLYDERAVPTQRALSALHSRATSALLPFLGADRRFWLLRALAAVAALALLVAIVLWSLGPPQALAKARTEVLGGHPEAALLTLSESSRGSPSSAAQALRAAALHALKDHDQELLALQLGQRSDEAFDGLVLSGVVDDWAHARGEAARQEWLEGLDRARLTSALRALAESGTTDGAWGALRYLDSTGRLDAKGLSTLYADWLEQKDCAARAMAAHRLAELQATEALPSLQRARKKAKAGCGLEEMTAAVRQLEPHPAGRER
jgi:Protein kinase domain